MRSSDCSSDVCSSDLGEASQSNRLAGEISVTIAEVYPNGTMLVRGEKLLTLNRGDERVQISGLIRAIDIAPDNRIARSKQRRVGKASVSTCRSRWST